MKIIKELKDRKVRKYLGIYISGCVTVIGLMHLFSLRYSLPAYIFDTLLILVMFGILSVLIIAWNHGKVGKQKTRWWEYILHLLIFLFALIFIYIQYSKATLNILPLNSNTIAVIPFINMSDSKEDEYFSDGIMEDILTQLSKISDFKVISRTTMMKYKKTDLSIKEIGRRLGAGSILEGSVRRYEDKVRITAQLINSSRDEHLWAETFDRKISDIFEVQSEIAKHLSLIHI
jgi:TolB-like protein